MKRTFSMLAALGAATLLAGGPWTPATAAVQTAKTTGSVALSTPTQYVSFDAFASNPVKGSVSYSNFAVPLVGSGVWLPESFSMGIALGADPTVVATYSQTVTGWMPTSPTSVRFAGAGDSGSGWLSTFTGSVSGSSMLLAMTEINGANPTETYALTANGTVAVDGSVTGTWSDNYGGGRTGTFVIADLGHEVFHYVAAVDHTTVVGHDAYFGYTVPANAVYSGPVYVHAYDGGQPGAGHDLLQFGTTSPSGPFTDYPVVSGNLTVFAGS